MCNCLHAYMCTLYGSRASQFVQLKAASLAPLNATKTFLLKLKRIRDERTQGSRQLPLFEVHVHVHTAITDYNYKSRFQNFYRFTISGSSQIEAWRYIHESIVSQLPVSYRLTFQNLPWSSTCSPVCRESKFEETISSNSNQYFKNTMVRRQN